MLCAMVQRRWDLLEGFEPSGHQILNLNVAALLIVYSIWHKTSITELAVHFYFARATVFHVEALFVAVVCCCLALLLAFRFDFLRG